jgi:hypothetical protein
MQALAAVDSRIRVLDNPSNLGFGGSYKRGARAATATYVIFPVMTAFQPKALRRSSPMPVRRTSSFRL